MSDSRTSRARADSRAHEPGAQGADVEGHVLEQVEQLEETDVEGHMFEQVEQIEKVE